QPVVRIEFDPERGRFWGRLPGVRTVERDAARGALGVARGVRAARWGPRPGPAPDRAARAARGRWGRDGAGRAGAAHRARALALRRRAARAGAARLLGTALRRAAGYAGRRVRLPRHTAAHARLLAALPLPRARCRAHARV